MSVQQTYEPYSLYGDIVLQRILVGLLMDLSWYVLRGGQSLLVGWGVALFLFSVVLSAQIASRINFIRKIADNLIHGRASQDLSSVEDSQVSPVSQKIGKSYNLSISTAVGFQSLLLAIIFADPFGMTRVFGEDSRHVFFTFFAVSDMLFLEILWLMFLQWIVHNSAISPALRPPWMSRVQDAFFYVQIPILLCSWATLTYMAWESSAFLLAEFRHILLMTHVLIWLFSVLGYALWISRVVSFAVHNTLDSSPFLSVALTKSKVLARKIVPAASALSLFQMLIFAILLCRGKSLDLETLHDDWHVDFILELLYPFTNLILCTCYVVILFRANSIPNLKLVELSSSSGFQINR